MKYPVSIEGFGENEVEIETPGLFSSAKLIVNGQPAPKGKKRGQYLLLRNDGTELDARLKMIFLDPVPQIVINNDQVIKVVEPLKWYQWIWAFLPTILAFSGGALGAALGFAATSFNVHVFRSTMDTFAKYLFVAIISFTAIAAFFVIAYLLT